MCFAGELSSKSIRGCARHSIYFQLSEKAQATREQVESQYSAHRPWSLQRLSSVGTQELTILSLAAILLLFAVDQKERQGSMLHGSYSSLGLQHLAFSRHSFFLLFKLMIKAMAPHSSTLAWKIPWTEEPVQVPEHKNRGQIGNLH
ncbi:hypothetical protein CapIbe_018474 [Capra ibex]